MDLRRKADQTGKLRHVGRTPVLYAVLMVLLFATLSCSTGGIGNESVNSEKRPPRDDRRAETTQLRSGIGKLEPFFQPMGKPKSGDWLASHTEPGQTFDEYLESRPAIPSANRQKLYVVALGRLQWPEKAIVDRAAGFLSVFYDLPVEQLSPRPLDAAPPNSRKNRFTRTRQVKAGYVLDHVLKPIVPDDAAALIAFTREDLYPNDSVNYIFGQASPDGRVAVWSLARLDDYADRQKFLERTLKIAAHETGHMFSLRHCTKYECLMSGTNHLGETDRRPIDACPECTAKICWMSRTEMAGRYRRLADFCRRNNLPKYAEDFQRKAAAVERG